MPELPEVLTITKNLKEILPNSRLVEAEIFEEYRSIPKISAFEGLYNLEILEVSRVGKYILIKFPQQTLMIHLGMTGRIRFSDEKQLFRWDKIRLNFQKNNGESFYLNFTDTRKFGKVKIAPEIKINAGTEPFNLSDENIENLIKIIQKKNTEIKNILLDQKIISGLGNIYANDTLFESQVNPLIKGKDLKTEQVEKIIKNAEKVLSEGISQGGSSMKDKMYTDIYGNYGSYQNNFKIYERENCIKCKNSIIKIKIKGRASYYCSKCQPIDI